jgi:hypothetical protein
MGLTISKSLARAAAAAGFLAAFGGAASFAAGPFSEFGGSWRGAGRISDTNGKSEALSCKSSIAPASDGIAASLSLVCASDSYKVDFHSDLYTDGQALRGTWSETTRSATGEVSGSITPSVISATTTAPGFAANIVIHVVGGKRLDVALSSTGTSINRVQVSMKR